VRPTKQHFLVIRHRCVEILTSTPFICGILLRVLAIITGAGLHELIEVLFINIGYDLTLRHWLTKLTNALLYQELKLLVLGLLVALPVGGILVNSLGGMIDLGKKIM